MKHVIEVLESDSKQACNSMCLLESALSRYGFTNPKVSFSCFTSNEIKNWVYLPSNAVAARQWFDYHRLNGQYNRPKFPFTFEVDIPDNVVVQKNV